MESSAHEIKKSREIIQSQTLLEWPNKIRDEVMERELICDLKK